MSKTTKPTTKAQLQSDQDEFTRQFSGLPDDEEQDDDSDETPTDGTQVAERAVQASGVVAAPPLKKAKP